MTRQEQQKYWRKQDRKKLSYERYFARKFRKALNEQIIPVVEFIRDVTIPDEVLNEIDQLIPEKSIRDTFVDLYERVGVEFVKDEIRNLKEFQGVVITKDEADDFENLWLRAVRSFIDNKTGDRIKTIIETSREKAKKLVKDIIDEGVQEGLGIPEIKRSLLDRIPKEWRTLKWRAVVIARTETLTAANEGSYMGAKATGLPLEKIWIARLDGRERSSHAAVSGTTVDMEEDFIVGGYRMSKPGDPGAPASEVVQCRCTVAFQRPTNPTT